MKKYELLSKDSITRAGPTRLYRIRALRDFGSVKRGTIGGYVEGEKNLSHDGTAWIADQAQVMDGACVEGNALVSVRHQRAVASL